MDSFATDIMEKSVEHTTRCSPIERSIGAIIIGDSVISKYVRSQYSKDPLFINSPSNIVVPISKIGSLENISTKLIIIRNQQKKTDLRAQYIVRKSISIKINYILSSISKYWQIINFDHYDYDIFEIDTIPEFYIVERRVKDWTKKHTHTHKRPLDSDEIVRIFIHNDVVLIHTTY